MPTITITTNKADVFLMDKGILKQIRNSKDVNDYLKGVGGGVIRVERGQIQNRKGKKGKGKKGK